MLAICQLPRRNNCIAPIDIRYRGVYLLFICCLFEQQKAKRRETM